MDDGGRVAVEVAEDFEKLLGQLFDFFYGKAAARLQVLFEGGGVDVGLDEGKALAIGGIDIEGVEVLGNGGVAEVLQHLALALEQLELIPVEAGAMFVLPWQSWGGCAGAEERETEVLMRRVEARCSGDGSGVPWGVYSPILPKSARDGWGWEKR